MEPYNTVLSTHFAMDHADVTFLLDNDALFQICKSRLDIDRPSYVDLNRLIAQVQYINLVIQFNEDFKGCVFVNSIIEI